MSYMIVNCDLVYPAHNIIFVVHYGTIFLIAKVLSTVNENQYVQKVAGDVNLFQLQFLV